MEVDVNTKCQWYTNDIKSKSDHLFFPTGSDVPTKLTINKHFIASKFTPLKNSNELLIVNKNSINSDLIKENLLIKFNKNIQKITNEKSISSLRSKFNNKLCNLNNVMSTKKIPLNLNSYQKNIIQNWINESNKVYNYCVKKFNENKSTFNTDYMAQKIEIFNELYKKSNKGAPYDMLTDAVRSFCSNVKSARTNLKNKHITHFKITEKSMKKGYSLFVSKKAIQNKGIFSNTLGNIKNFNINILSVTADARLFFDNGTNVYWLHLPSYKSVTVLNGRKKIAALDPGEKTFMTYFSESDYGTIGDNIRIPILEYEKKIRILQRSISNKKNKCGNKLKNKNNLILRIKNYYNKIKNLVKELHNQTALYLCKNYDTVLIPSFGTQKMISDKKFNTKKASDNEIKKIIQSGTNVSKNLKAYSKQRRLNSRVKFVLQMESHYSFRQHLLFKGQEYGCEIKEVTEEYTSQCCTKCGLLSKAYNNRIKICSFCKYEIDRDINGSRNILLKNINNIITVKAKSRNSEYIN